MSSRNSHLEPFGSKLRKREKVPLPPRKPFINLPYVRDPEPCCSEQGIEQSEISTKPEPIPVQDNRKQTKKVQRRRSHVCLPYIYATDSDPEFVNSGRKLRSLCPSVHEDRNMLRQRMLNHIPGDMTSRLGFTSPSSSENESNDESENEKSNKDLSDRSLEKPMTSMSLSESVREPSSNKKSTSQNIEVVDEESDNDPTDVEVAKSISSLKVTPSNASGFTSDKKYKNGTRASMSFPNERIREIERHNAILLRRIQDRRRITPFKPPVQKWVKPSPALAKSRQEQRKKIALENALLDKRLQEIKAPTKSHRTE